MAAARELRATEFLGDPQWYWELKRSVAEGGMPFYYS